MSTKQELQDQIYELQVELQRSKKLLGQALERQNKLYWSGAFALFDQEHLDREIASALAPYRKIFGSLYWKKDLGI
jgi:hypothetical protein